MRRCAKQRANFRAGALQGRRLIGVINSLAVRRDVEAVDVLIKHLQGADADVAAAAAVALGRIGGAAARAALEQSLASASETVRNAAAEGYLLCADRLLSAGQRQEANGMYEKVRAADVSEQRRLEATRGVILARGSVSSRKTKMSSPWDCMWPASWAVRRWPGRFWTGSARSSRPLHSLRRAWKSTKPSMARASRPWTSPTGCGRWCATTRWRSRRPMRWPAIRPRVWSNSCASLTPWAVKKKPWWCPRRNPSNWARPFRRETRGKCC